ncbi:hypothetical protein B7494_g3174 [Chlorociboria aeruginascens]|nr:hypothetical protein B7494_g3174 [Chlorociboria aeruginascens]
MSPSRGSPEPLPPSTPPQAHPPLSPPAQTPSPDAHADASSSQALRSTRDNIHYLLAPSSPNAPRPLRFRTRALLRSLHYLSVFLFWRVVRYAKYAVVGSIVAAVGASALGGLVGPVAWFVAPTGVVGFLTVVEWEEEGGEEWGGCGRERREEWREERDEDGWVGVEEFAMVKERVK